MELFMPGWKIKLGLLEQAEVHGALHVWTSINSGGLRSFLCELPHIALWHVSFVFVLACM